MRGCPKLIQMFLVTAGLLLLATAVAKFISSAGSGQILQTADPLLRIPNRHLFWLAGSVESVISLICFFSRRILLRAALVASLAIGFAMYRVGLWWIDYQGDCPCLGNLTGALHIQPEKADMALTMVLLYLLLGSLIILLWYWKVGNNLRSIAAASRK
jgi:hypothetical protein